MFHCEKIKLPSEQDVANKKNTRAVFLKKIDNAQLFRLLFLLHLSLYLDITKPDWSYYFQLPTTQPSLDIVFSGKLPEDGK